MQFSLFICTLIALLQFHHQGDAAVTLLTATARAPTSITVTWVISPVDAVTAVTIRVDGGAAVTVTNVSTYTATGLAPCIAHTFTVTQALGTPSTETITASTTPPVATAVSATVSGGDVTVTWTAPSPAPTVGCPYWMQVNLVETSSGRIYTVVVPGTTTTVTIFDVTAGTYFVRVYSVTTTDTALPSSTVTITVAAYTTTTTTTTATTTQAGGQFLVSLKGKLYNSDGTEATYRSQHSVMGSTAFASAATATCNSVQRVIAGNSTLLGAMERCFAVAFTNGSLIGEITVSFTASKLPTSSSASILSLVSSLVSSQTQTGDLMFSNARSPVTVTVTKNAAITWRASAFNTILIASAVKFLTSSMFRAAIN